MIDVVEKLKKLPADVYAFATSMKASAISLELAEKHNVSTKLIGVMCEAVSQAFVKDIKVSDLLPLVTEKKICQLEDAKNLVFDLVGMRLLVVDSWLDGEASKYLISQGVNLKNYEKYVEEHKQAIKEEKAFFEREMAEDEPYVFVAKTKEELPERKFNLLTEKMDTEAIFKEGLADVLLVFNNEFLDDYNQILLMLLSGDESFKTRLENLLYENEETITEKDILIETKQVPPSIKNWLKHFVLMNGTDKFDLIKITEFLSKSENAKVLSEEEKRVVSRLLKMYRNIKFFPHSLESLPHDQWEIIPTEKATEPGREKQLPQNKPAGRDALIQELKGNIDNYAPGSLEREILEEEDEKDREYHKLILLKNKYPEGSLERRAVEEELRKMGR